MTDDPLQTAAAGLALVLLSFELVVAARSWYAARRPRRTTERPRPWLGTVEHGPLLLSRASMIRGHLAERRPATAALRRRYEMFGTSRFARQLRSDIERARATAMGDRSAVCSGCRQARLRGQARCVDCGRRLMTPATTGWA